MIGRTGRALFLAVLTAGLLIPLANPQPALADVTFEQKMLELINQRRATAGIGPVQASLVLNTIAGPGPYLGCGLPLGGRASDMGARNYFSHTILNCGTQSVFSILASTVGLVYSGAAENIAWMNGTTDPLVAAERLTNDLMNSPGHRANMLDPRFTHVGIGSWRSPAGQPWSGGGFALQNVWITAQVFAQMPLASGPAVSLSSTSLTFGDRAVNTTGPAQAVSVRNTGSAALSISGTSVTGANAGDFPVVSNDCGTSVAPGASCSLGVAFRPSATGARAATLSVSDSAAGSPHTVALTGTGTAAPLPEAPINIVATGGDRQVTVTWAPAPSGPAAASFGVFFYDTRGFVGSKTCASCTSAVLTGLSNGTQYYAAVYSNSGNAWGGAGISNPAWALKVPGMPANQQASSGDGSLTTTWQALTDPAEGVEGYGVFVYDANGFTGRSAMVCATCTTATIPGLANGTNYIAILYARNANGWGPMSASPWVTVGTPGLVGNVRASNAAGALRVSWSAASTGGAVIVGYGAYAYDSAGYTGKSTWVCGTCTSGVIEGLTPGKTYTVLVYGYNSFGWGLPAQSNAVTA